MMSSSKEKRNFLRGLKSKFGGGSKGEKSSVNDASPLGMATPNVTSTTSAELLPRPSSPKPTSATASTLSLRPAENQASEQDDRRLEPWARAFLLAQTRSPELMADYARHVSSTDDAQGLANSRSVEVVVEKLIDTRKQKQWTVSLRGKDVNIRRQVERLTKFLVWSDNIVKSAVSAQPYAALAWSAVSILLPFLESCSTQHDTMLEGFNLICHMQLYWKICEDDYSASLQSHDRKMTDSIISLYSHIIEYQARMICHLSGGQFSRGLQKIAGWNDWSVKEIETIDQRCKEFIPHLQELELRDKWQLQLDEMQKSRAVLDNISNILVDVKSQTQWQYDDQRERDLLQDLFSSDYEKGKNFNPRRVPDTCEWFFKDERFQDWRDSKTSALLWVSAGPGCGKSVLSRCLVDESRLSTNITTSTVCYFFFKDGEEGRMDGADALSAILHQLFSSDSTGKLIEKAMPAHKKFGKRLSANLSELWRILKACAQSLDGEEIICILDALDECNQTSRAQIMDELKDFYLQQHHKKNPKLRFLVTSRPYDDLEELFQSFVRLDGDDKSDEISHDIGLVIDAQLGKIAGNMTPADRDKISGRLKSMENRTYLWLYLTFSIIEDNRSKYRKRSTIEGLLSDLPLQVSDAYEKILDRSQDEEQTEMLLRIVLGATRPLTLDETNVALTVALGQNQFTSLDALRSDLWPRDTFKSTVRNLCGLFLSVYDDRVFFIHQTAREFLTAPKSHHCQWKGRLDSETSHELMSRSCIGYMLLPGHKPPTKDDYNTKDYIDSDDKRDETVEEEYRFFPYAAVNWLLHFKSQGSAQRSTTCKSARELCRVSSPLMQSWWQLYRHVNLRLSFIHQSIRRLDLAFASFLGLAEVVDYLLIEEHKNPDLKDSNDWAPLTLATYNGHKAVVQSLLRHGADIEITNGYEKMTSLLIAAEKGPETLVRLLLDSGANIDAKDNEGSAAIQLATNRGQETIVRLLLDRGADIEARNHTNLTPLALAAERGHEACVRLLLDRGANIEARNKYDYTPLALAADLGNEACVQLLLDRGADIEARNVSGETALFLAVYSHCIRVVEALLRIGADINTKDGLDRTPILIAAGYLGWTPVYHMYESWEGMVQLLLDNHADIEVKDRKGRTPLSIAREKNFDVFTRMLIAYKDGYPYRS